MPPDFDDAAHICASGKGRNREHRLIVVNVTQQFVGMYFTRGDCPIRNPEDRLIEAITIHSEQFVVLPLWIVNQEGMDSC